MSSGLDHRPLPLSSMTGSRTALRTGERGSHRRIGTVIRCVESLQRTRICSDQAAEPLDLVFDLADLELMPCRWERGPVGTAGDPAAPSGPHQWAPEQIDVELHVVDTRHEDSRGMH